MFVNIEVSPEKQARLSKLLPLLLLEHGQPSFEEGMILCLNNGLDELEFRLLRKHPAEEVQK